MGSTKEIFKIIQQTEQDFIDEAIIESQWSQIQIIDFANSKKQDPKLKTPFRIIARKNAQNSSTERET